MSDKLKQNLTLGSLFSGSGGFELAGLLSGIKPVWASEVEPFPIRVTTKRMPFVEHLGEISQIDGGAIEPVDIITFGSPCQDLSIAGTKKGLTGNRSNLFYEATRVIKEMREKTNGRYPRYIVWENVRGAFSSNKGNDFWKVLKEITSIKGCKTDIPRPEKWANAGLIMGENFSVGWRLFDSQHWGVREENASTLSQILQAGVPEKYYLSQKACLGILRRASKRGKELPAILKAALERQAASA